ncbi:MAG TPA: MraY family glycosyltransferase [Dyella sp.]|nr:MraY family glycosyltransferase [Dyella sp.]
MLLPRLFVSCATAILLCAAALALIYRHAPALGLLDRPNERKKHLGNIPLIGGIAVFIGLLCGACVAGRGDTFTCSILGTAAVLTLTGALDDRFDLSVRLRLVVQSAAILVMMGFTGVYIRTLGNLFGVELELGVLGIPLTLIAVIGLLNAFNMMDGLDGLAGMLALVSVGAIASFQGFSQWTNFGLLLLLSAALLPYLAANLGLVGRKVFLGDAGSVVLGYLLAWTLVRLSQQPAAHLTTVDVLWCVALPVLDTLAVMIRRMRERRSPFKPDRGHIHHLLLDAGMGPRAALVTLVALAILLVLIGTQTRRLAPGSNLLAFGALAVIYITAHSRVRQRQHARVLGGQAPHAVLALGATSIARPRLRHERTQARGATAARSTRPPAALP